MLQPDDTARPDGVDGQANENNSTFSYFPAIPPPVPVSLTTLAQHPCPYLPDRTAQSRGFLSPQIPGDLYRQFMDAGFRRSGNLMYQPVCAGCRACQSIRVPVNQFTAGKSQRRCLRRNENIRVTVAPPNPDRETFALYTRYVQHWHQHKSGEDTPADFVRFLYDSPVDSLEFKYRDESGRVLAVGICDVSTNALSSVYFYFDPDESDKNLGTFGALYELDYAKANKIEYYYLGFWVKGCGRMEYKNRFRPYELLGADGKWMPGL